MLRGVVTGWPTLHGCYLLLVYYTGHLQSENIYPLVIDREQAMINAIIDYQT